MKQLGIIESVLSVISMYVIDGIYKKIDLAEWDGFDDAGSVTFGICLILLSVMGRN